jgi:hypothetical protein
MRRRATILLLAAGVGITVLFLGRDDRWRVYQIVPFSPELVYSDNEAYLTVPITTVYLFPSLVDRGDLGIDPAVGAVRNIEGRRISVETTLLFRFTSGQTDKHVLPGHVNGASPHARSVYFFAPSADYAARPPLWEYRGPTLKRVPEADARELARTLPLQSELRKAHRFTSIDLTIPTTQPSIEFPFILCGQQQTVRVQVLPSVTLFLCIGDRCTFLGQVPYTSEPLWVDRSVPVTAIRVVRTEP